MKHILKYSWGCLLALAPALMMSSCEDEETVGDLIAAEMPSSIELVLPGLDSCRNAFFHRIGFACGNTAVCIYR